MASEAAQEQDIAEYRVRIAFISSFIKFTQWPAEMSPKKNRKVEICIYGDPEFKKYIEANSHTDSDKLQISVKAIAVANTELATCNILFIGKESESNIVAMLGFAKRYPILTISDNKDFADNGGIVEIIKAEKKLGLFSQDKVNLRINMRTSEAVNIGIDARILQIAEEIIK